MAQAAPSQQNVSVINTAANPVLTVDTSANRAFQTSGGDAASRTLSFTVPSSNRLAIETITYQQSQAVSGVIIPTVTTTANGTTASHVLPATPHPVDPARSWGAFSIRLYADPNTQVTVSGGNVQLREFIASVSGYLVPAS